MSYIVSLKDLEKLAKGELKVEDLAIPENIALSTWSGEDVKGLIEQKKLNIEFEDCLVNEVAHRIGHCGCGECVQFAFYDSIEEMEL